MIASLLAGILLLDTPTPTPTPPPANQPVSSFVVPPQAPPWPVPVMPTWGTGTPIATLYAATPPHSTEYPGTIATATAQVGQFIDPISGVSTPIAGMINAGPTAAAGDISTGSDPYGGGTITFATIGDQISSGINDAVAAARGFLDGLFSLISYSPWLAPVPLMLVAPTLIGMFLTMIVLIFKGGTWLVNFVIRVGTLLGSWIP